MDDNFNKTDSDIRDDTDTQQDDLEQRPFREKAAEFLNANGFFVVAGLCVLCLGIALAARLMPRTAPAPAPTPYAVEQAAQPSTPAPTAYATTPAPAHTPVVEPLPASAPAVNEAEEEPIKEEKSVPASSLLKAPPPVEGDIIWGYAVDTLLYSKTLELWTTHEGIDIAAKKGAPVKAIKAGKVESVYDDDALGVCVRVEHEGGLTSLYANLASKPPVSAGQPVNTGDTVGYIGNTATSEIALESHLHFALFKNGEAVDPSEYVLN